MLMCSIAEGSIGGELAVAELIVTSFGDIERDGTATSQDPLALAIAHWVDLAVTARAPVVRLAARQEHMCRENTSIGRHARGSVATFFVGSGLSEVDIFLLREVSYVVHCLNASLIFGRAQDDGVFEHNVAVVGSEFAAYGVHIHEVLNFIHIGRLGLVLLVWEEIVNLIVHFYKSIITSHYKYCYCFATSYLICLSLLRDSFLLIFAVNQFSDVILDSRSIII